MDVGKAHGCDKKSKEKGVICILEDPLGGFLKEKAPKEKRWGKILGMPG